MLEVEPHVDTIAEGELDIYMKLGLSINAVYMLL